MSLQLRPTLCGPIDSSPPGSAAPGILQARSLECVAISFSNVWKWKVKVKSLSCALLLETTWTAAHQAPPSMGFSRQEYRSGVPLPSMLDYVRCYCIAITSNSDHFHIFNVSFQICFLWIFLWEKVMQLMALAYDLERNVLLFLIFFKS